MIEKAYFLLPVKDRFLKFMAFGKGIWHAGGFWAFVFLHSSSSREQYSIQEEFGHIDHLFCMPLKNMEQPQMGLLNIPGYKQLHVFIIAKKRRLPSIFGESMLSGWNPVFYS